MVVAAPLVFAALLAGAPAAAPARPASTKALPPVPIPENPTAAVAREQEIGFEGGAPGVTLSATLALPPEGTGKKPYPALLLVPGDGLETYDRDTDYKGIKLFRQIAQRLAAAGIASLRYDKRGVGKSKGDLSAIDVTAFGADARAAFRALRGRPEIDARRVGALAFGDGAVILLEAFAEPARPEKDLAAVVLLAASSARGEDALIENKRLELEDRPGTTDKALADALAEARRIIKAARTREGLGKLSPRVIAFVDTTWYRSLIDFDPRPRLAKLKAPVLVVHGQKDRQVSADHALKIRDILAHAGNKRVEVVIDPFINHLLTPAETGSVREYGALGSKADPETIERIALWTAKTLGSRR